MKNCFRLLPGRNQESKSNAVSADVGEQSIVPKVELISDKQTKGQVGQWTKVSQSEIATDEPQALPHKTVDQIITDTLSGMPYPNKHLANLLIPMVDDPDLKAKLQAEHLPKKVISRPAKLKPSLVSNNEPFVFEKTVQPDQDQPKVQGAENRIDEDSVNEEDLTDEEKDARDEELLRNIRERIDANSDNDQSPTFKINENESNDIPKSTVNMPKGLAFEDSTVAAPEDSTEAKLPVKGTQDSDGNWISSNQKNITPTVELDDLPVDANLDLGSDDGTDYQSALSNDDEENRFKDFDDEDEVLPEQTSTVEPSSAVRTAKAELSSRELLINAKRKLVEKMLKTTRRTITPEQLKIIKSAVHGFSATPSFLDDLKVWVDKTNDLKKPKFNALFRKQYSKNENKYLDAFEIVKNLNQKDLERDELFDTATQVKIINRIIEVIGNSENHGIFETEGTAKPLGN